MSESQERGANMPDNTIETDKTKNEIEARDADLELREDEAAFLADDAAFLEEDELEEEELEDEEPEQVFAPAPTPPASNLDVEERVRLIAAAADAVRAEDIEVLDIRELTIIADYFMICTGKSSIQLRAIADRIDERMREEGIRKPRIEGYQEATWILLDYGDIVCHLMAAEQRDFYNLEEFWNAAPRLPLDLLPEEARNVRGIPTRFETLTAEEGQLGFKVVSC